MSSARPTFEEALTQLNVELIKMGATVEKSIMDAVEAFKNHDEKLAKDIVAKDRIVDDMEKNIEAQCLSLILRQQPVAGDLRVVSTALKMVTDMERIGDHAENIIEIGDQASDIAELIPHLGEGDTYDACSHIPAMAQVALEMVHGAINAFVEGDVQKAKEIINKDDIVDDYFDKVKNEVADLLREKTGSVDVILNFLMIAKYFERIGDHAENICEWVEFSKTGEYKDERII